LDDAERQSPRLGDRSRAKRQVSRQGIEGSRGDHFAAGLPGDRFEQGSVGLQGTEFLAGQVGRPTGPDASGLGAEALVTVASTW